jgi:hypothetical protein
MEEDVVKIKIRGGTVDHGQRSLCETCRWSTHIRGKRLGDEIVECGQLSADNQRIPFAVAECSRYSDRNQPGLREMEDAAWILRSDPPRNRIGFVRSSRLAPAERYVLDED